MVPTLFMRQISAWPGSNPKPSPGPSTSHTNINCHTVASCQMQQTMHLMRQSLLLQPHMWCQQVKLLQVCMTTPPIQVWSSGLKILDDKPNDGSSKGLAHFLSKLSQRARDSGWVNITKTKGFDIFHKYGMFTIQDSRKDAVNRFQYDLVGNHIIMRDAQASWQMMTCLMNSCTLECLNKVRHSSEDHVITSAKGEVFEDGPLFLHILVSWVVVDKCSTESYYTIN